MKYSVIQKTIAELIEWIKKDKIDLHPPYQRNFVWTLKDQKLLIDSIMRGYPLPNFIISLREDGIYEMVDGQQRATTISKFVKNEFPSLDKKYFRDIDQTTFMDYNLVFVVIDEVDEAKGESLEEYFSLVNKRGIHLNTAEVNQAQYHNAPFMIMINRLMDLQGLSELDIFTSKTKQRMNDRSLIEELVAYLFVGKITDKRKAVEELLEATLDEIQMSDVSKLFEIVLGKLCDLNNKVKAIKDTRFRQRNDFYTLFVFVAKHDELPVEVLNEQYRFLVFIDEKDYIKPSNEDCDVFQEYAFHCVTQSNSKNAREQRLEILEDLLICKTSDEMSERLSSVCEFLEEENELDDIPFKNVDGYDIVDVNKLS
jgi:hypothetical protein